MWIKLFILIYKLILIKYIFKDLNKAQCDGKLIIRGCTEKLKIRACFKNL